MFTQAEANPSLSARRVQEIVGLFFSGKDGLARQTARHRSSCHSRLWSPSSLLSPRPRKQALHPLFARPLTPQLARIVLISLTSSAGPGARPAPQAVSARTGPVGDIVCVNTARGPGGEGDTRREGEFGSWRHSPRRQQGTRSGFHVGQRRT